MGCNQQKLVSDSVRVEADLGIPKTTMSEIVMQDFGIKHVAKFIPQLLLPEQKEHCAVVTNHLIHTATNEPDFLKVLTGDES